MLGDIIVLLIVAAIILAGIAKIIVGKRNGVRCSGCPHSKTCSAKSSCCGSPVNNENTQDLLTNQKGD